MAGTIKLDEDLTRTIENAKIAYGVDPVCACCGAPQTGECTGNLSFDIHTDTVPAWKFFLKDLIDHV